MGNKLAQYLKKGTSVMVAGRMVSREYEKDGQKRTAWSVRADNLQLLGGKKENADDAPF
jgi:single-strand DNA-binding protein